jgi:hypothetical protein|eukprot:COSAG02_NODE_1266_length_13539_cov_216.818824_5_plen_98_part_00
MRIRETYDGIGDSRLDFPRPMCDSNLAVPTFPVTNTSGHQTPHRHGGHDSTLSFCCVPRCCFRGAATSALSTLPSPKVWSSATSQIALDFPRTVVST